MTDYLPAACVGSLALVILLGVFARWDIQKRRGINEFAAAVLVIIFVTALCALMVQGP